MKGSRQKEIIQLLKTNNVINSQEIADRFNVSIETIRRDLSYMEKQGVLRKIYGGAELVQDSGTSPVPLVKRKAFLHDEKVALAAKAASFIPDNCTIALDAGTTTYELCSHIKEKKNLIVICSDIQSAECLLNEGNNRIYIMGGFLTENGTSSGAFSKEFFKNISKIDVFVFSTDSIDPSMCLSTDEDGINELKKRFLQQSNLKIALIDHSKFMKKSFYKLCDVSDVDIIITDSETPKSVIDTLKNAGCRVEVVDTI